MLVKLSIGFKLIKLKQFFKDPDPLSGKYV
jgi:hypothetical protein